jgi:hypothetical protein
MPITEEKVPDPMISVRGLFAHLAQWVGAGSLHSYTLAQACSLCEQVGLSIIHTRTFVIDWLLRGWVISIMKQEREESIAYLRC